jgi:hypothetical protein
MPRNLDRFTYDGSEPVAVTTCGQCDEDIYEGDEVAVTYDGETVHEGCWRTYCDEFYRDKYGVIDANGNVN